MKRIPLTQGKFALVDDADYGWLSQYNWCAHRHQSGKYYAVRSQRIGGRKRTIRMSREILGLKDRTIYADHWNGDTLDNRRANLRPATNAQNQMNSGLSRANTSGFKGVTWIPARRKWQARIRWQDRKLFLGYFDTAEEAYKAYRDKARELYGEFPK